MNPLTAQQISRTEHSQRFQQASQKEPSTFLSAKVKPFHFITKFFTRKQTLKESVKQASQHQNLQDSSLGKG